MLKETYFTPKTIQTKSKELLAYSGSVHRRQEPLQFQPEKISLLALDLQEYFLQEDSHAFVPSATAIVPGINALIAAFVKTRQPVIATRHINTPEDAGMMSKWWRDLITPQTAYNHYGQQLKLGNAIKMDKTQYDAFLHTELEETLRSHGVEQVIVTGVMTHLCCETTARSAFMRGFEVFFAVDGTATYNEALHRASLLTLSHGFAIPVLVDEILIALDAYETR